MFVFQAINVKGPMSFQPKDFISGALLVCSELCSISINVPLFSMNDIRMNLVYFLVLFPNMRLLIISKDEIDLLSQRSFFTEPGIMTSFFLVNLSYSFQHVFKQIGVHLMCKPRTSPSFLW